MAAQPLSGTPRAPGKYKFMFSPWRRGIRGVRGCVAAAALAASAAAWGCEEKPPREGLERVVMSGRTFWLEPALDDPTRIRGLGGRERIPEGEGMLFVFPRTDRLEFVMRDCLVEIDIAYLDDAGRVVQTYTMAVEPREPGESDIAYEVRLRRYPSRFPARFAVEVAGGTLGRLGVKAGDQVVLDTEGLKRRAR
jgi:uncharacterized membrane protein (UPF0127 family)